MTKSKSKIDKIKEKKETHNKRRTDDAETKKSLAILMNIRLNIYQRVYQLMSTDTENWRNFDFLSSKTKVNNFIEKLEREINNVKSEKFNFEKYKTAINIILGTEGKHFMPEIIKNMYIAKLQNIIFLIKESDTDNNVKETKETKHDMSR